jgi:hypothetical protein
MSCLRFFPLTIILRNQKIALLLLLSIFLLILYRLQNSTTSDHDNHNHGARQRAPFEDSVAYCNAPEKRTMDNRSHTLTDLKLMQLQVLIRHGDRAPIDLNALPNTGSVHIPCFFNNTKYVHMRESFKMEAVAKRNIFHVKGTRKGEMLIPRAICRGGQLTPYGYVQHLILGDAFRKTYAKNVLKDFNIAGDLHVQATDHHRTIQSGASFLTGVFYEELMKTTPKVVINVHPDRLPNGHMLLDENGNDLPCAALKLGAKKIKTSRSVKHFDSNVEPMITKMAGILLVPRQSMPSFNRLVDILFTKLCHGQGVPMGPHYRLPHSMVRQALQFSHVYANVHHSGLAELQTLSILSQFAQRYLDLLRKLPSAKKLVLYSAHDTTVGPFLQILNVWDGKWPPYASNVIVEFYERQDNTDMSLKGRIKSSYFRVVYNGVALVPRKGFCRTMLFDNELCPVSDLFRYVSNNVYEDSLATMDQSTFDELLFKRIKTLCTRV